MATVTETNQESGDSAMQVGFGVRVGADLALVGLAAPVLSGPFLAVGFAGR